jgi:glycosyltransferase involved in cell wall biosynthesis
MKARNRFGLREDQIAVGVASRLIEGKGHRLLLEAMSRAILRVPHLALLLAGDGPLRQAIEHDAMKLLGEERTRLVGFVSDMRELLSACDIFVIPTSAELGEGFGLAALEAMAVGCPVIASRVGALPEVVLHEDTGLLFSAASPQDLTQALVRLAESQWYRHLLGARGHQRASDVFSLEAMTGRTLEVYREIVMF